MGAVIEEGTALFGRLVHGVVEQHLLRRRLVLPQPHVQELSEQRSLREAAEEGARAVLVLPTLGEPHRVKHAAAEAGAVAAARPRQTGCTLPVDEFVVALCVRGAAWGGGPAWLAVICIPHHLHRRKQNHRADLASCITPLASWPTHLHILHQDVQERLPDPLLERCACDGRHTRRVVRRARACRGTPHPHALPPPHHQATNASPSPQVVGIAT